MKFSATNRPQPIVHLYRGAPAVRSWSKHKATVYEWALCGIKRQKGKAGAFYGAECTEEASQVSCPHCKQLMGPGVGAALT